MEQQRPLRLGDLVDDYCPKERRLTNHAIVAIVEDVIRQTRCTACESEHPYKGGKAPVRRKKEPKAVLYDQVLANVSGGATTPGPAPEPVPAPPASPPARVAAPEPPAAPVAVAEAPESAPATPPPQAPPPADDVWTLNRPLIRASLPRNDSQPPPRAIPEFTMHQRSSRGSQHFRGGGQNGNSNGYRGGFRAEGQGEQQPGGGGQRRRRRRHKAPRSQE